MVKVKIKKKKQVKKKFLVKFQAPDYLDNFEIGESNLSNLDTIDEKRIMLNLAFITKSPKHQNVRVYFKSSEVNNDLVKTEMVGYETVSYYLVRIIKKGSSLVDDSFKVKTKDNKIMNYKPIIVSKSHLSSEKKTLIRKFVKSYLEDYSKKSISEDIFKNVINGTLQNSLRNELKKYTSIKIVDFKKIILM